MGITGMEVFIMDIKDLKDKINRLEQKIKSLPQGSIGKKKIKNNEYFYLRYNENGKRIEKYLDSVLVPEYKEKIEQRKKLEKELKELIRILDNSSKSKKKETEFYADIRVGEQLGKYVKSVKGFKRRECFKKIEEFIYSDLYDKVFILYGLRRTGKTTMIRQTIADMTVEDFSKAAFIQISSRDTLANINKDLRKLESLGYKYVFIDEVTLMKDFIEGAALFSDIYAASGMKIVLSGTDSLSFMLTKSNQLYDRCIVLHTTFIPYREFYNVLGISGLDEYIRFGGTMSLTGINYNQGLIFNNTKSVNEYVDTAIAKNIQHSLKYYDDGNHFRHLQELYEKNELTNVINRVVEDINHRFTKDVLIRKFKSNDLSLSSRNLRMDRNNPTTILDDINIEEFTNHLKQLLEILDSNERKVKLDEIHAIEIKEYLNILDLIFEIEVRTIPVSNEIKKNTIISQPGLRYAQAKALIDSLLLDEQFNGLSIDDKEAVLSRIVNEIKGRMMEDIILLETKLFYPEKEVFKLQFSIGEFDMVIFDPKTITCEIYEIKHSEEIHPNQYRFLIEEEKLKQTEFRYGNITRRCVIYSGESRIENNIEYKNVEEYLLF